MTFWQEFALVFSEIGWLAATCLAIGLIFIIIEIFQPGFGVFGITGGVLVIAGIVIRVYHSGNGNPLLQAAILIACVAIIILAALVAMIISMRCGLLSRTGFVQKSRAVDVEVSQGTEDYSFLIGKRGRSVSILRPGGNALIDGKVYTVISSNGFIQSDVEIVVESVEGVKIMVNTPKQMEDI